MEKLGKIINQRSAIATLQTSSQESLQRKESNQNSNDRNLPSVVSGNGHNLSTSLIVNDNNECFVSLYRNNMPDINHIAKELLRLRNAFPALPTSFFEVLTDRLIEKKISNKKLSDAVDYLIDNFIYPTPTIGNILTFDKKAKVYSYGDICKINNDTQTAFSDYRPIEIEGMENKVYWASVIDIQRFGLKVKKIKQN